MNNNQAESDVRKINISGLLSLKTLLPPDLPLEGTEFELRVSLGTCFVFLLTSFQCEVSYAVSPDNFVIVACGGMSVT